MGTELSDALGRSAVARHPLVATGTALLLGLASGPAIVRGVGPAMAVLGSTAERVLTLASLALGPSLRRFW